MFSTKSFMLACLAFSGLALLVGCSQQSSDGVAFAQVSKGTP